MLKSASGGTQMQAGANAAVTSFMGTNTLSDTAIEHIADAVVRIVEKNFTANSTCERAREALANGKMTSQAFSTACSGAFAKQEALTESAKLQNNKVWKNVSQDALNLSANLFVQFANGDQRSSILTLLKSLNAHKSGTGSVLGPELLDIAPDISEVRCFDDAGCAMAEKIIHALTPFLPKLRPTPKNLATSSMSKPTLGTTELWISKDENIQVPQ